MTRAKGPRKPSRAEVAADEIARLIFDGSLRPGQKLIEQDLAQQFKVSRVPVREALRELSREGLVRVVARRGAFVARMDRAEVAETYDVRALLEGFLARLCAEHIGPKAIVELEELLGRMREAVATGEVDRYSQLVQQFNHLIWEHTPNRVLRDLVQQFARRALKLRLIALRLPGRTEQSLASHERQLDAIRRRDSRAAEMVRWLAIQQAKHALMAGYFGEAKFDRRSQLEQGLPNVDASGSRLDVTLPGLNPARPGRGATERVAIDDANGRS